MRTADRIAFAGVVLATVAVVTGCATAQPVEPTSTANEMPAAAIAAWSDRLTAQAEAEAQGPTPVNKAAVEYAERQSATVTSGQAAEARDPRGPGRPAVNKSAVEYAERRATQDRLWPAGTTPVNSNAVDYAERLAARDTLTTVPAPETNPWPVVAFLSLAMLGLAALVVTLTRRMGTSGRPRVVPPAIS